MSVGTAVSVAGTAVRVGMAVDVAGTDVLLGTTVIVYGKAVSVNGNGSVGRVVGMTVLPGMGVGYGVRVAMLGTQSNSPGKIKSPMRQLTVLNVPALV